ncbi:SLATT domain-containing protein [Mumia sp. ZJ430]|uniref:SLATT domain-containing protein n=1 Tax=Mumia sp. ZJ430 TaxID=2708083 RepID=UPI0014214852|nr:SLATT domain-containing protein [Mumia sp. ZJ430]
MWTYRGDEPTVVQWLVTIRVGHEGHRLAAKAARRRHRLIGATAVVLAALAASASFTSLLSEPRAWLQVTAGALAVATAATALLHTLLNDADVIAAHQRAGAEYGDARRQLEQAILSERITDDRLSEIRADWTRVEKASPTLPGRASRRAAQQLEALAETVAPPAAATPATVARDAEIDEPLKELTAS